MIYIDVYTPPPPRGKAKEFFTFKSQDHFWTIFGHDHLQLFSTSQGRNFHQKSSLRLPKQGNLNEDSGAKNDGIDL